MTDPDGVLGKAVQTATVRTRAEPRAATGGRDLHVYPPGWKGTKQEPAFSGLLSKKNETRGDSVASKS